MARDPRHSRPPNPMSGGFHLPTAGQLVVDLPLNWSGRIWPRQGCSFDQTGGFRCQTGDCSGLLQCGGVGGRQPATLVEMTLGSPTSALHYYDVSLVDGFNVPVSMVTLGSGKCAAAACEADFLFDCKFLALSDSGLDDGQMTPDTVLEPTGSTRTSSGSDGYGGASLSLASTATTEIVLKKRSSLTACRSSCSPVTKISRTDINKGLKC